MRLPGKRSFCRHRGQVGQKLQLPVRAIGAGWKAAIGEGFEDRGGVAGEEDEVRPAVPQRGQ